MGRHQKRQGSRKSHLKPKARKPKLNNATLKHAKGPHCSPAAPKAGKKRVASPPIMTSDEEGSLGEGLTDYDLLMRSLDYVEESSSQGNMGWNSKQNSSGKMTSRERNDVAVDNDENGGGDTMEGEGCEDDDAMKEGCDAGDSGDVGGREDSGDNGDSELDNSGDDGEGVEESEPGKGSESDEPRTTDWNKVGKDPFAEHFEQDLSQGEIEQLTAIFSQPLKYQHKVDPVLRGVSQAQCLPGENSQLTDIKEKSFSELHVKKKLAELWNASNSSSSRFSVLQEELYAIMGAYQDMMFSRRTFDNGEEIRRIYLLHTLNHILKARSRVLKNNARLTLAAKKNREIEEVRDHGLTRPKVLILVPFREAALRTVNMLIRLLLLEGQGQVNNRKRFIDEFREEEHIKSKVQKPASYESMFAGNIDDCFRVGVSLKRNTINLYTNFYSSDLIIASPLGLRTIIGAKGDKTRDFDFLSSLELIILDQADVYLMQNWDHVLHLFEHTHLQPQESHGVDFSRVRMWCINGWSQFYRQTLVFSSFETPEINSLFRAQCRNYAGRVRVSEINYSPGSISQVAIQVSHVFRRFSSSSHLELPKTRFQYFVDKVLPDFTGELTKRTCILVPSYLDFIHLRNHMAKQEMDFEQLNEYTKASDISRTRTKFFHGGVQFLLYTERMHFFRRFKIRGICHIIFYSLPCYSEFYPELVNLLEEMARVEGVTCTVLYSRYDSLALCRVVGTRQAKIMLTSEDNVLTLVTGEV